MEQEKLMTKQELIDSLDKGLKSLPVEELIQSFKEIRVLYERAGEEERKTALANFVEDGGHENDFEELKNPLDSKFKELVNLYTEKKQAHKKELAEQLENNYIAKREIIAALQQLVDSDMANVGAAFNNFYELRDKWNGIGDVNQARFKQLQHDYSHLVDLFYYNVGVHKQLQNYDLRKNGEMKAAIIEKLSHLKDISSIRQLEHYIKKYQNEWDKIGPTTQEKWEELKSGYWTNVNEIYEKIRTHYLALRDRQKERIAKRQELLQASKEVVEALVNDMKIKEWNALTDKMKQFQEDWKQTGFSKKESDVNLWETFRGNMNTFFEKKAAFYGELKEEQGKHEKRKLAIIEKAEALKADTNWQETSKKMVQLQNDWKRSGRVAPKLDQKLWKRFRTACDTFFNAKKEYFDTLDDRQDANLKAKQEAVKNIAEAKDEATLSKAVSEWHTIGYVPKKAINSAQKEFDKAVSDAAKKLKISDFEQWQFELKIKALKQDEKGADALNDERRFIKSKIDKLQGELSQYENNLSFFGQSKGAQKLKEVVEQKMKGVSDQMNALQSKLDFIKKA